MYHALWSRCFSDSCTPSDVRANKAISIAVRAFTNFISRFLLLFTKLLLVSIVKCIDMPSQRWSGGAMVLGKLPEPGRPTIWIIVGQGPVALAVGADGGCLDIFTLVYPFLSRFSLPLGDGPI